MRGPSINSRKRAKRHTRVASGQLGLPLDSATANLPISVANSCTEPAFMVVCGGGAQRGGRVLDFQSALLEKSKATKNAILEELVAHAKKLSW